MVRFASIVLVDARGWILLQERDEHPEIDPEKWGFVGGHVEDGEDYETAAYRELTEETGLRLASGLRLFREFGIVHEHSGSHDRFALYVMATDLTDDHIGCHEGRQIVFVDPARIGELRLSQAAALAVPPLLASDLYRDLVGGPPR